MRDELPALPGAAVEAAVSRYFVWRNLYADPEHPFEGSEVEFVTEMATVMLDAACRLEGPGRLVPGRELDEAHRCIAELGAKYMKSFVGMWTTAVAVERDEARAEVARLRAGLGEAADKLETYATWVVEPDRHAKMLRAARRAREATDAPQ